VSGGTASSSSAVVAAASGKAADWSDVPDDKGYGPMRDAIVAHVRVLLDEIQRRRR